MHLYTYYQGRRHEGSAGGGGTDSNWGTDSGESRPPTPKFQILLGFHTLYFGNIGKTENFENITKIFF